MRLDNIKQPKTDGFNVFASLPDMGKVGGLASAYLAKNVKSECVAEIVSNEKPWVSHTDGVVKTVNDLYQLYYDTPTLPLLLVLPGAPLATPPFNAKPPFPPLATEPVPNYQ